MEKSGYKKRAQAHSLDAIYNNLARRVIRSGDLDSLETYLRLALKAQAQCRATLETLSAIKNPQPVAFVRQANIAHGAQQVNNGTSLLVRLVLSIGKSGV